MKTKYLIAGATALALTFGGSLALAKGNSDTSRGRGAEQSGDHRDHEGENQGDHGRGHDCGVGHREHGDEPAGARDPKSERGGDCPASSDHGRSSDDADDNPQKAKKAKKAKKPKKAKQPKKSDDQGA